MIEVRNLGFRYPRSSHWVFEDLSFDVDRGRVFAILGPNGRGKTTLLKCLAGLASPSTGSVKLPPAIGYVPQHFTTPFAYTVLDIVLMGRARHIGLFGTPRAQDRSVAVEAMADLGIGHFSDRLVTSLSGGERQLVLIARALASSAEIMVLDEPTSALDFRNQAVVLETLGRLSRRRGLTVVMTTHHPQHALEIADIALLMHKGADYTLGAVRKVLTDDLLSALYDVPVQSAQLTTGAHQTTAIVPVLSRDLPPLPRAVR